jgi:hypothetical protein
MFKEVDCQMEARAGIAIVLLLVGCAQPQVSEGNAEPIMAVSPTVVPRPVPQQRNKPRRLKLRLTLDQPGDLKVKVGDSVSKGQVISERSSTRAKLIQEREALQRQLKQAQSQMVTPSYAVEKAEVEQARLQVKQARVAISRFNANSPWTDHAYRVLPLPEEERLSQLEAEYHEAQGELVLAVAKLQVAKQNLSNESDTPLQRTALLEKLQAVEAKVSMLGVVEAPYDGLIKAIRWLGQTNQELEVEITLSVVSVNK